MRTFLKGAAILGVAGLVVKILGAIYRIPLSNIIDTEGMGYYQTAYPIYVLLLTISTAGFPVAIAKLVSEKTVIGDYKGAHRVFKVALTFLIIGGIYTSLFVLFSAEQILHRIKNPNAYYALVGLVPALFFVPIMSAFRGYFQGRQDMLPTAISQILEQFFRVISGLFLTYNLLDRGSAIAAGGASAGGSIGALIGTIIIIIIYVYRKREINAEIKEYSINYKKESINKIIMDLLVITIPITLGASLMPIMDTVDETIIFRNLQNIGFDTSEANDLYGQLKGFAQTLVNFPQAFSVGIAMSLVPFISDLNIRRKYNDMKKIAISGVRVTLLVGLPCTLGLFILAKPIIRLLYFRSTLEKLNNIGDMLQILSFGVIFIMLIQTLTAIFQGINKAIIPVINLAIGVLIKALLTYILTSIPYINIKGAAISTVIAYFITCMLNLINLKKHVKLRFNKRQILIKPLLASIVMAFVAKLTYVWLIDIIGDKLSTILSIIIGAIIYFMLLLFTNSLTYKDFSWLPGGKRIFKKLDKYKLIK